jgi:hypothetical protein
VELTQIKNKEKKIEIDVTVCKINRSKNRVLSPRITPVGWMQKATGSITTQWEKNQYNIRRIQNIPKIIYFIP